MGFRYIFPETDPLRSGSKCPPNWVLEMHVMSFDYMLVTYVCHILQVYMYMYTTECVYIYILIIHRIHTFEVA